VRVLATAAAAAMLLCASCDDGQPRNVKKIEVGQSGGYLDQLRGLSQQNRDLALRRAIQDAGQTCKRITTSGETGTYKNMSTWTARCEGGLDWAIFIAPSGDVQVRSCGHVQQLGLPACEGVPPAR
jgi:hypothetical protein